VADPDQLVQERRGLVERVDPVHPGQHRGVLDHGDDLVGHLQHDLVGVAVGQQPGQRSATGHPVPAGVVDDDQIDPAGLLALRRKAGAGAAADDRLAPGDLVLQPFQDGGACDPAHDVQTPLPVETAALDVMAACSRSTIASANSGAFTSHPSSTSSTGLSANPDRTASNRAASAAGSKNTPPSPAIAEIPRSGRKTVAGPTEPRP